MKRYIEVYEKKNAMTEDDLKKKEYLNLLGQGRVFKMSAEERNNP